MANNKSTQFLGVLAAACGKSGTAAFRSRTPRFAREPCQARAPRAPLRAPLQELHPRCEALYLEGRCRHAARREQSSGKEQKPPLVEARPKSKAPSAPSPSGKAWAEEVLRRHQQRLQQREEMRRCKAEQRAEEDLKECSFAPKLVSRSHIQLQIRKGRRQIEQLAEQQQAILFRLNCFEDEEVRAASFARWSASRDENRSLLLAELAQVDDDAHAVITSLVKLGIPSVLEEPDPGTLCPQYDSGLLRRLRMEDAWGLKELAPIRTAGPLPPAQI
ncbi:unnamed protein product [Symbiodinium sp. CCMP2456]|nr:unnamed protein product [Symbiodinium sp. CCMP2456]